ncbi:MAG: J domain-containing protein [Terracidiphilus sp.]
MKHQDHYEFMQISPNAEPDTIHRVFRFLAARFHPDNPETGDVGKFSQLREAYDVLSNPASRTEYDATHAKETPETAPMSSSMDFMDSLEGELNRRLAVLAVLYIRRRAFPNTPEVTLSQIEGSMGFPRDYLEFTLWYLLKKGYISRADNSALTLTAEGVDFVETQRVSTPTLSRLLTSGAGSSSTDRRGGGQGSEPSQTPPEVPVDRRGSVDRRSQG